MGNSAFFLRSIDPHFLDEAKVHKRAIRGSNEGLKVLDVTREELIALIRDTKPNRLFSVVEGPFYRLGLDPRELSPSSRMVIQRRGYELRCLAR